MFRSLIFVICDTVKKEGNIFFNWKGCPLFFKILSFQQPLRFYRNDQLTSIVNVRIDSGPL